ncbi:TELO2-interacting protein 2-like [Acanthaster planci]|uniref:TELO2-interacting protein 2-like n=1 Tax=Acanthaster planci TaxID=133434 RepID=A0A8B7Z6D2_ACAPL|nr:TELO2-interacting protein 2-like [Acanthaster planci]
MEETVRLCALENLLSSLEDSQCRGQLEIEKRCAEVHAAFQHDSEDSVWFLHVADNVKRVVAKVVASLVGRTMLPQSLSNENEDDCFRETASITAVVASTCAAILSNLHEGQSSLGYTDERKEKTQQLVSGVVSAVAPHCVVLAASHCEKHPWTSKTSRQNTNGLCTLLCKMSGCNSASELLMMGPAWCRQSSNVGIFKDVLGLLKERLTRDQWHREPATRQAFRWCLLQVKHPHLGQHLDSVLPASLLFVDDYKENNKYLGVLCLQHIIKNVDPTDLRLHGRAMVIFEALHHQLYTQKPALIGQLLPCLVSILAVIERSPHKADEQRKPNRYDTVLQTILISMEFEQKLALRRAYTKNLHLFIDSMGITILRHMKRVLRVILKYLEASDGHDDVSRMHMLQSLKSLILQSWPRIPAHWEEIIKVLLKLLFEACDNRSHVDKEVRQPIIDGCAECLVLLKRCCRKNTEEALREVLAVSTGESDAMKESVERVLDG